MTCPAKEAQQSSSSSSVYFFFICSQTVVEGTDDYEQAESRSWQPHPCPLAKPNNTVKYQPGPGTTGF